MGEWKMFLYRINKGLTVDKEQAAARQKEIKHNRAVLRRLLDVILYLAKQNLAFHGHREGPSEANRGNFLELLQLLARYDTVLADHLKYAKRNETYTSPGIQNDFIQALGHLTQQSILQEVKEAKLYSILLDTTQDISHIDQLSFCV